MKQKDFKEGMSITCEIKDTKIDDAKLHYEDGKWYICQNKMNGHSCGYKLGYEYSWNLGGGIWTEGDQDVRNILPKKRTIKDIEYGDIVQCDVGQAKKCIGRCGEVVFLSYPNDFKDICDTYTIEKLKEEGYKFAKQEEKEVELSMDEIAEKFDVPVERLKIKKEK